MDKKFLFYFFAILRASRFLPRKFKGTFPKRLAAAALIAFVIGLIFFGIQSFRTPTILPQENGVAQLYANTLNSDLKSPYLKAIYSAKKSLLVIIYSLRDSSIINALRQQSLSGVDVTVVCDAEASVNARRLLGSKAKVHEQQGIGLMHLKLLVVDDNQVWIGSANLTGQSLARHGNLVVGLNSPTIATAIQQLAASLINPSKPSPSHVSVQLAQQKIELWFLPKAGKPAFHRLMNLFYQAKKNIRIAMFAWTHSRLADAIIDAHERGVKVEIVLDREQALDNGSNVYKKLLAAGIDVGLSNTEGLLHYKMAWVDEDTLVNGSANWTLSAFSRNDDCFLVMDPLTPEQKDYMTRLWENLSQAATYELRNHFENSKRYKYR